MRVSLISSAFNSMTQRFYVELVDGGYDVAVDSTPEMTPAYVKRSPFSSPI